MAGKRTDPENNVATPELLSVIRESVLELASQIEAAIELMQKSGVHSVDKIGIKTVLRSIDLIEGAIEAVNKATKKTVKDQRLKDALGGTGQQPTPEAKAGANVAKLIVKREKPSNVE